MINSINIKQINASIVLYHNKKEELERAINSFLSTSLNVTLYLVDNSSNDSFKEYALLDNRIVYIFNNANLGYGAAHNIAIRKSIEDNVLYHLILNPDIYFETRVITKLFEYMQANIDVGHIMPKVTYPDGTLQYLCKLLPTPMNLFGRRFLPKKLTEKNNDRYELKFTEYNKIMEIPYLSGCFMFLRTSILKEIGLFDERFFMYPEDIDLTRRINEKYKTVFYPEVTIVHNHAKDSYKSKKMLLIHVFNIVKYFNKWGWFFDSKRRMQNHKTLEKIMRSYV